MESLNTAISVQVNKKDKEEATAILNRLGVTMSGLINMTLKQVILRNGVPFDVREPKLTKNMRDALEELDYLETHLDEYKKNNNWEDLKKELLSDD